MSDARLRDLEREAERDPAARVRWLTERLRAGTLIREHAELAAYAGDDAALLAIGWEIWPQPDQSPARVELPAMRLIPHDLADWARGLARRWSREACVRAHVAATRAALAKCCDCDEGIGDEEYGCDVCESLASAEAWLACPCEDHESRYFTEAGVQPNPSGSVVLADNKLADGFSADVTACARLAGEEPVRDAISRALIAWALA